MDGIFTRVCRTVFKAVNDAYLNDPQNSQVFATGKDIKSVSNLDQPIFYNIVRERYDNKGRTIVRKLVAVCEMGKTTKVTTAKDEADEMPDYITNE